MMADNLSCQNHPFWQHILAEVGENCLIKVLSLGNFSTTFLAVYYIHKLHKKPY